jgi:type 1 glutamine amidotransferase
MRAINTITRRRALLAAAAAPVVALSRVAAPSNSSERRRVLLFTKSSGFEHEVVKRNGGKLSLAENILTDLGMKNDAEITATKDGRVFDGDLSGYSSFCFFTTGNLTEPGTDRAPPMSAHGKNALLAAIRQGKGFLGLHCASDTFHSKGDAFLTQTTPDPYISMLGGEFLSHGRQQEARVRVVDAMFPGLRTLSEGFKVFEEWYSLKNFSKDLHVIMVLETEGMQDSEYARPPFPLAWARKEGKGRVYFNAMGHREDVWTSDLFQRMLAGALAWTTGKTDVDLTSNMFEATPQASTLPPHP